MKQHKDGHDLTQRKTPSTGAVRCAVRQPLLSPPWFKLLAKIIDMTKEFAYTHRMMGVPFCNTIGLNIPRGAE
jgi:hypothetical protein